jgi:hypothetical protein
MGLGGILQELKTEGVLALYHDYRSGRLVDYSGNGNNGVATAISFSKKGAGYLGAAARIIVPSSPTLQSVTGTMMSSYCFKNTTTQNRLINKRAITTQIDWFHINTTQLALFDGINLPVLTVPITVGRVCNSVSWASGNVPVGYQNGVLVGNYSLPLSPVLNATDVTIGNQNIGVANVVSTELYRYALIINRVLSATEHSRIYAQLENMTWNTKGLTPGPMMP